MSNHDYTTHVLHRQTLPALTLIRGPSGSGKSTLAQALVDHYWAVGYPCHHFEADMAMMVQGEYKFCPLFLSRAHDWCKLQTEISLRQGNACTIVSNTFTRLWEMKSYFQMAQDYGAKVQIITLKANFGNVHNVPQEVVDRHRKRMVPHEDVKKYARSFGLEVVRSA